MIQNLSVRDEEKKQAAITALNYVQAGMVLGLGTGSTVAFFLEELAKRNLPIQAIATSIATEELANKLNIALLDPHKTKKVDIAIDGADEVDEQKRMIKGGGGALMREKICAAMADETIIIVDSSKLVKQLGAHPLPLEVIPWGMKSTEKKILSLGYKGTWREDYKQEGGLYITNNGNFIFDITFENLIENPEAVEAELIQIPGILTTGFFFNLATKVIVSYGANKVQTL